MGEMALLEPTSRRAGCCKSSSWACVRQLALCALQKPFGDDESANGDKTLPAFKVSFAFDLGPTSELKQDET